MSLLNQVFQGDPNALGVVAAGGESNAPNVAIDTVNNVLYVSAGNGWVPGSASLAKSIISSQTAATQANLLTYTPPVSGLYRIDAYAVQDTATGGTLPEVDAAYTEAETSVAVASDKVLSTATGTNKGDHSSGSLIVNALGGVNIVLSSKSAVTLTYSIKTRIEYLG